MCLEHSRSLAFPSQQLPHSLLSLSTPLYLYPALPPHRSAPAPLYSHAIPFRTTHPQLFHGWYLTPYSTFSADASDEWGLYNKALTAKALLEKGYAIIAPAASSSNEDAWDTNCAPYADELSNWSQSDDYTLLNKVFDGIKVRRERERASSSAREQCLSLPTPSPTAFTLTHIHTPPLSLPSLFTVRLLTPHLPPAPHTTRSATPDIKNGAFGAGCCNINDMHGVGFSSGAYMTSRMAFSYPNMFKSLSVQSGSYYYCDGSTCAAPSPQDFPGLKVHPPTLFLHGTADPIVPPKTRSGEREERRERREERSEREREGERERAR